ncbi:hypothetical protein [Roseovarius litorisediminis]|nr:hypothetical protein [Roseovarius litorisediminis]
MERRARQSAERMRNSYGKATNGIASSFKKLTLPALGGLATVGGLKALSLVAKGVAQIGDEAKRAGVPLKEFQEWKFVAEQNRIGIDQMIDGLKELNIRADEFFVTGKGPGAEAFARLGFGADELKEKLKNPSELLLEIMGRLEDFDTSSRIRISDEIFGGSAGERFVELVGRGEAALRTTIQAAHDTGAVLDSELIAKADELDRRFAALQTRVSGFGKKLAVELADAGHKIVTLRTDIDDLFQSSNQARGLLGDDVANALEKDSEAVKAHKAEIEQLVTQYERLADQARIQSGSLLNASNLLRGHGYNDLANTLAQVSEEMSDLSGQMQDGTISADTFEKRMSEAADTAQTALGQINAIDKADFGVVITGIGRLVTALGNAANKARELRGALPGASPDGSTDGPRDLRGSGANPANASGGTITTPQAVKTSLRPRLPGVDASFGNPDVPTGDGGGSRTQSDFERELESIAAETAALRLEAQALAGVTNAQIQHGDAIDFARTKAELLAAAQRSGVADTPELRAQIDQLATEYSKAGQAAEIAADKIAEVQAASRRGAESVASAFEGMATGAFSAKEAVAKLIIEIVKLSLKKRLLETAQNSGGFLGKIFSVIGGGFAAGGFTGQGGKFEPAGVVHKGEFVVSKEATQRIGVGNLEALHKGALRGFSDGGLVGGPPTLKAASAGRSESVRGSDQPITINAPITISGNAGTPEQNNDLAKRISKSMEGTMRGVVVDEIRKQTRPGNMLNNGRG